MHPPILPPMPPRPVTLPPARLLRARDRLPRPDLLMQPPSIPMDWVEVVIPVLIGGVAALIVLMLMTGCSGFEMPEQTIDSVSDYALLQTLPEPGPRPASFECTLGDVTVSGDSPHITRFEHEGFEPVTVYSEDEITDVHMSGVRVVVVGDLLVVGDEFVRLGECDR